MKQIRYLFGGLLFLFASTGSVTAQEVSDYSKLQPSDYSSITLPPLDLLFENAKSAPTYELATVKEQIERKLLAKEKRAFLGFFSLRGSYQYGMFGNESTYTDVAIAPYLTYATQAQNGYTVGAGVNIPLDGLFDLTARVKRQKLNVRTAQLEREVKFEEMKKEIILLYATATSQLNILKLNAEALMLANVQYSIAEKDFSNGSVVKELVENAIDAGSTAITVEIKDFSNGAIDSGTLSSEKSRQSDAQEKFENSKFELSKSLMILELVTHTPILRNK